MNERKDSQLKKLNVSMPRKTSKSMKKRLRNVNSKSIRTTSPKGNYSYNRKNESSKNLLRNK